MTRMFFSPARFASSAAVLLVMTAGISAQEVRRAEPVGDGETEVRRAEPVREIPVRRAVPAHDDVQMQPFEFDKPTPRPRPKSTPAPTAAPVPAATPDITITRPVADSEPAPAPPAGAPDEQQLDYANGLYSRKYFDLAAVEYEKYLTQFPDAAERATALFRMGESHRQNGDIAAAKNAYDTLLGSYSSGPFMGPASYRLAEIYYKEKDYALALPLFRRATVRLTEPAAVLSARFFLARCLENVRRPLEARSVYEDVVAAGKDNPFREAALFSLCQLLADTNRREDAVKYFSLLAAEAGKPEVRAEAAVKGALMKIEIGRSQQAADDLRKALAMPGIGPWKELAQVGLVHTDYDAGRYQDVIDAFEKMKAGISADRSPELTVMAANACRQLGQHDKARALYDEIIKNHPDTIYAKESEYERLVSLYNANDPSVVQAADALLGHTGDGERRDKVTLLKAEALYKTQKFAEAAAVYSELTKSRLTPALKADALFKLGWCYMQTGEWERASLVFSDFLRYNPTHKLIPTALAQRALAFQQLKKYTEAMADYGEIITRHPKSKERELALLQKALILGQQQDNRGMTATFRQLLAEYPKSPAAAQANYWIGWAAFESKDYKGAVASLSEARRLDTRQFFERATLRVMLAHYYLEEVAALDAEVDRYTTQGGQGTVPPEILRWLGAQYFPMGDFAKVEKFTRLLVANKEAAMPDDMLLLGRALEKQDKHEESITTIRTYLDATTKPSRRAEALLVMGRAQLGLGKFDDAQKSADEACSQQPEGKLNAEGRLLSGDIAVARGDSVGAAKIYMSVSVVFDDSEVTPRALDRAIDAYRRAGNADEAAKVLNTLRSRYPEYQPHSAAL
jgi:TolA-binding protein